MDFVHMLLALPDIASMDEKARKILLKAYWGSGGWKSGKVSDEEFAYCKTQGVMFDNLSLKHPELVRRTMAARDAVSPSQVGEAFIASLSTRKLWLRSAIGSYANCLNLVQHPFRPNPYGDMGMYCDKCGSYRENRNEELSTLNFERVKWGGVRHDKLIYNLLDLQLLAAELPTTPNRADRKAFKGLFRELRAAVGAREGSGKLKKRWQPLFPCNQAELGTLFETFSIAGIIDVDGVKVVGLNEDLLSLFFE